MELMVDKKKLFRMIKMCFIVATNAEWMRISLGFFL